MSLSILKSAGDIPPGFRERGDGYPASPPSATPLYGRKNLINLPEQRKPPGGLKRPMPSREWGLSKPLAGPIPDDPG